MLSPRLQLKVAQKQILTPGLVQMVTILKLNRMELKEMINQEIAEENPVGGGGGHRRVAGRGAEEITRRIAATPRRRSGRRNQPISPCSTRPT